MMTPSHLLGALILGHLVDPKGRWRRAEWALALGFGVVIDLDHALAFPAYVMAKGPEGLTAAAMLAHGASWQGFMHTPWGLGVALAVGAASGSWRRAWIPAAFWGLHMFQDFVVATRWVRFGSLHEVAVIGGLAAALGLLWWNRRRLRARARGGASAEATAAAAAPADAAGAAP